MVHYVVVSAEIWCPHREEIVVLAIFSALSVNGGGGENDQQKFKKELEKFIEVRGSVL